MIEVQGDLFETEHKIIGHGVNCQGIMGAGVAKIVHAKFPKTYDRYAEACTRGTLVPGKVLAVGEGGKFIFNMATQNRLGPDAQYVHVLNAALDALSIAKTIGETRIAIPRIGAGIGGLNWEAVALILQAAEKILDGPEFVVYSL